jgi:hypothetical protein
MCNLHNAAPEVKPAVKACRDLATLPYGPIRARLAGQWEAGLKNILIIWISGGRRGGIVWVNPSSKCASCHSNETDQRNIHTHVNVSLKAYVYDERIYNCCARARFAGCTYLRNIILALNTVYGHQQLHSLDCLKFGHHNSLVFFTYLGTSPSSEFHFGKGTYNIQIV